MGVIARLVERLRAYFIGVQQSREDLAESTSEHAAPRERRG